MKKLIAFYAITGLLLLADAAAEDRMERIDLAGFTCKQFLQMNRDDALIVVGGSKATTSMSMRRRSSTSPGYLTIALTWQTAVQLALIKGC
jgi:hypothetical protein